MLIESDQLVERLHDLCGMVAHSSELVFVHTHCIYPSRAQVRISVQQSDDGRFHISDDAAGLNEVLSMGASNGKHGYYLGEQARRYGVEYSRGAVMVTVDDAAKIPAAVMLVANASKDGVLRSCMAHEVVDEVSFDFIFDSFVTERYAKSFRASVLKGASGQQRTFRYVHQKGNLPEIRIREPIVLVDPVSPSQMSLSMKMVAQRDLARLKLPHLWHTLVINSDVDKWSKTEIKLLEQEQVPFREFRQLEKELPALVV